MSKSILVIDDEPDQRDLMREILELFGYQVMTASNGQEALHTLTAGELPGLILLDVTMPIMSGREFLATLHSGLYPQLQSLPIVVISAVAEHAQLQQYNCKAVLTKPSNVQSILGYAKEFCG